MANWLARDANGDVLDELSFNTVAPEASSLINFTLEYTGYRPVKVYGFYILPISELIYEGSGSPVVDYNELIRWADEYTPSPALANGNPGLEVVQVSQEGDNIVIQVKSGSGDASWSYVPYVERTDGIVHVSKTISLGLRITAPSDTKKEILSAAKYHFLFDVVYEEISTNIEHLVAPEAEC